MTAQALTVLSTNGLMNFADLRACNGEVICSWTAATAGTVSLAIASQYAGSLTYKTGITKMKGRIGKIITDPGTPAPTAGYSLTLLDNNSVDVLQSACTSLSATATAEYVFSPEIIVDSDLTLTVSGAGDGGQGKVTLYFVE